MTPGFFVERLSSTQEREEVQTVWVAAPVPEGVQICPLLVVSVWLPERLRPLDEAYNFSTWRSISWPH